MGLMLAQEMLLGSEIFGESVAAVRWAEPYLILPTMNGLTVLLVTPESIVEKCTVETDNKWKKRGIGEAMGSLGCSSSDGASEKISNSNGRLFRRFKRASWFILVGMIPFFIAIVVMERTASYFSPALGISRNIGLVGALRNEKYYPSDTHCWY